MFRIIKRINPGAVTVAVVFLLIQALCSLYLPYITADIVNNGVLKGNVPYIWSKGFVMLLLSIFSALGAVFNTLFASKISYRLGSELREDIFRKALCFSKNEFDIIGTSSMITRSTNDVTQVQYLVEMGLKFLILSPVNLIGGIVLTYLLSPTFALVFLGVIPFLIIAAYLIYRFATPLYGKTQGLLDRLNLLVREGLTGVRVIRAFNKEDQDFQKYRVTNQDYTRTSIQAASIMNFFVPLITMLVSLTTVIITWIGGKEISAGGMQVGTLVGVITYAARILLSFKILTSVILAIPRGQISAGRINEVLDMPLCIKDPQAPTEEKVQSTTLVFDQVGFRYRSAKKEALENISLDVSSGQTLAVIGSTGSGKSTIVNLISRLYDANQGRVLIGGVDIRDMPQKTLHSLVSFTPQKSTLFFGTIRFNMQMAKPDATDEEIWAALDMACATEFIQDLPDRLDSKVEKGGSNFSGGQKQRLCLARSLLKDAAIYVFDDSFSAVDFKTDQAIRSAMKGKLQKAITVIVAQRSSTAMDADKIAVLNNGTLAGLGTHEELKKSNSIYQEILNSQSYKEGGVA